ncbi:hypothetical protein ACWCXB_32350 [Streptomyces sp. NPDC001514]
MDPIVLAAGTALIGAMATDGWLQARTAMVALWRRVRPDQADAVGSELESVRTQVVAAVDRADEDTVRALAGVWHLRLQQLLGECPGLVAELQRLLEEHLVPALPPDEQSRARSVLLKAEAHDNARVFMAARDQHITGS